MGCEPQSRLSVLVTDDDMADRLALKRALRPICRVAEAASEEQLLAKLAEEQPDCVVMDYHIPGCDTMKLLESIAQKVAVIIVTGTNDLALAVNAMKSGAQDYLLKENINPDALQRAVRHAVERMALLQKIEQQRVELELLATTDSLTGLYNRRFFYERINGEIDRARRVRSASSLLLIDLDRFKNVNDEHGHLFGDRMLMHTADVIRTIIRKTDVAARYGGEEFCVLAIGSNLAGGKMLAERLCRKLAAKPIAAGDGHLVTQTCSVGVASLADAANANELIGRADKALYQAKRRGRNRVACAEK